MARLKELCNKPELFSRGHRACAGCAEALAVRQILLAADQPLATRGRRTCARGFSRNAPADTQKWPC